ncbi:MAG: hypothetical protein K5681_00075 [Treponema sp.]|nr:hypothetical protein [Treponema sp.]
MLLKKFSDKPFRLMSIIGCLYLIINALLNIFTDFTYSTEASLFPFSKPIFISAHIIAFLFCVLTFFLYTKHIFYYAGLELLIFVNLYIGEIYSALFMTSILFFLLLLDNKLTSKIHIFLYLLLELAKLAFVFPYGLPAFFEYIGISLFSLCTIACMNLLFRHAYNKKDSSSLSLDDYKFTDRQKDCIKETVLNNTTIKELAINHKVSESAIKKDLSHIYNVLGISGKADLKALFIDYKF